MANNYLEIVTDIKTRMETVTDVGVVHKYYRWNQSQVDFINFFIYNPTNQPRQIRGWEITRISATEHHKGCYYRHHKFKLSGFMSFQDIRATDLIFQSLIDEVCNVFRNVDAPVDSKWWYMDGDNEETSPAQTPIIKPKMFGNVLCHTTEITLTITERIIA